MNPIFEFEMKVRDYECDAQGHVNNANYQHFFEVARHEFFEQNGFNFFELHKKGIDAVVARIEMRFKSPLYGAQVFKSTVDKIEKKGALYIFHQSIVRNEDQAVCATAKVDVASVVNGRLSRPEFLDEALKKILNA